jgi:uncharacterized protein DUF5666
MASIRRSSLALVALLAVALGAAAQAPAPQATRVRGKITAVEADTITVDGKTRVRIGDKTEIIYTQAIALADIQPGDFVGVTSKKGADGRLTATEVRRFPRPVNPGHRPFDGRDDQTMTNATVGTTVQARNGRELSVSYPGGSQSILVPATAPVSTLVPGQRSQLVQGAPVNLTMDAAGTALRLQVGTPKQ